MPNKTTLKFLKFLKFKWTAIILSGILGARLVCAITIAIMFNIYTKAKSKIAKFGIIPDKENASDLKNNKFISNSIRKLNILALDDSETADYSSLIY